MLNLVNLNGLPIFEQLELEEALLRVSDENWCLINHGAPPAIVMGISNNLNQLVHRERHAQNQIPIIKRYSGGGSVVIDENTLFITFICSNTFLQAPAFPEHIHSWALTHFQPWLKEMHLRENDYCLGSKKFGGNAQYITKSRFVHHSSLLWSYDSSLMDLLTLPEKAPRYRDKRAHSDFLCTLQPHFHSKEELFNEFTNHLKKRYSLKSPSREEISGIKNLSFRKTSERVIFS